VKIRQEHIEHMRRAIGRVWDKHDQELVMADYESGNFPRSDNVKDLQKRFCFDVMRAAGLVPWICDNIYNYANDDQLYTALKSILPTVEKRY